MVQALCRYRPRKVIAVSTDEVWGSIVEPGLADEDTPYRPTNPYAASKAASDHIIAAANNTYDLGISTVWFTTLYGPWQMPGKLISTAVRNRLMGRPVPIHGEGLAIREFTYVEDAVAGLLAVFTSAPRDARYVVGSGVRYSALGDGSYLNTSSLEFAATFEEAAAAYPLSPGHTYDDMRDRLLGSDALQQVTGLRGEMALYSTCPWIGVWLAADQQDDPVLRAAATEGSPASPAAPLRGVPVAGR